MELHVPIQCDPSNFKSIKVARKTTIYRVVPGPFKNKNELGAVAIATIEFNSKFTAVKIRPLGGFFIKTNELVQISKYVSAIESELGKPKKKKKKGE